MKTRSARPALTPLRGVAVAAVLALASPALAADTYQFDKSHTTVGFQVRHIFTMLGGKFQDFAGTIKVDRAKPENSTVEFTVQVASINTNDPKRDEHLKSPDFFDVAKYPTITFKSTSVKPAGDNVYQVTGDLTMHGVTKSITFPITNAGTRAGMKPGSVVAGFIDGALKINRNDFGIKTYPGVLGDDVEISLDIEAGK